MNIILNKGEVICSECKSDDKKIKNCKRCFGEGKLDWIENIVGKKRIKVNWTIEVQNDLEKIFSSNIES